MEVSTEREGIGGPRGLAAECAACHDTLIETTTYCLGAGLSRDRPEIIWRLLTCAELCRKVSRLGTEGWAPPAPLYAACAGACEECAEACSAFVEDPLVRACVARLDRCARGCRDALDAALSD